MDRFSFTNLKLDQERREKLIEKRKKLIQKLKCLICFIANNLES